MNALDPEATRAVQALAAARSPDEDASERAWAAMQQRLLEGPPPIDIATTHAGSSARWIATGIAIAAALVFAVGLASWSAGWIAGVDARAPEEAPYSTTLPDVREDGTATVRTPAPVELAPTPVVVPPPVEPTTAPIAVAPSKPGKASKRRSEPAAVTVDPKPIDPPRTTTLEAEMRLLARANAAMRAGRHADALAVLDEHARDFPRGQLAPEREYERALALCELGRSAKARAVADAFVRAHPRSPLRAKAEAVCREGDPR